MHEWRCSRCGQYLGKHVAGQVVIIHHSRVITVAGTIESTCPCCGTANGTVSIKSAQALDTQPAIR